MHIIIFQFDGMKLGKLLGWLDSLRIALGPSHYKAYMNQGDFCGEEDPPPLTNHLWMDFTNLLKGMRLNQARYGIMIFRGVIFVL